MSDLQRSTPNTHQEVGQALNRYTVSQLIAYFAADLPDSSNYPRHAKAYVLYCLSNGYSVDGFSFSRYTAEAEAESNFTHPPFSAILSNAG